MEGHLLHVKNIFIMQEDSQMDFMKIKKMNKV